MSSFVGDQRLADDRPAVCLSTQLLATYKAANESYYAEKRLQYARAQQERGLADVQNRGYDDEHGNYIVQLGEEIHGRFLVKEVLGRGSFGVVVKAFDQRREELVAVKIIRNRSPFAAQALSEISILTELNEETSDADCIVRLRKYFTWQSHLCLVFELLSFNLYDLIKFTRFAGVSSALVRKFGLQLTRALAALRRLPVPVIHGDLKPENILLLNPKRSSIKLIDFGSGCYANKTIYRYIQSRYYRSPEVILGLPYDCGIDSWSLGCILVELYTGRPLFPGRTELDQLWCMRSVLGDVPETMILQSPKRDQFYHRDAEGHWVLRADDDRVTSTNGTLVEGPHHSGKGGDADSVAKNADDLPIDGASRLAHSPDVVWSRLQQLLLRSKSETPTMGQQAASDSAGPAPAPTAVGESVATAAVGEDRTLLLELLEGLFRYNTSLRSKPVEWLEHPFYQPLVKQQQVQSMPPAPGL